MRQRQRLEIHDFHHTASVERRCEHSEKANIRRGTIAFPCWEALMQITAISAMFDDAI